MALQLTFRSNLLAFQTGILPQRQSHDTLSVPLLATPPQKFFMTPLHGAAVPGLNTSGLDNTVLSKCADRSNTDTERLVALDKAPSTESLYCSTLL